MAEVDKTGSVSTPFQRRLSFFLLTLLVLIGGGILWVQNRYDPADWRDLPSLASTGSAGDAALPPGLSPLSPPEHYTAQNLSDKINGKADLYLTAGFLSLQSRRFGDSADQTRWMERFVYDMSGYRNAFAVYSAQKRSDAISLDVTPLAYLATNGLFFVHGPYYIEIIGSDASEALQALMKTVATDFVANHSVESHSLTELGLFPPQDRVPHSTKLIAGSAFGIAGLDWIFTSHYADEKAEAIVFISRRSTANEARSVAKAFIDNWITYGAEAVSTPEHIPGARVVLILDAYEIAMVQGPYIVGVHEATDLEFGAALVTRLRRAIQDAQGDGGR